MMSLHIFGCVGWGGGGGGGGGFTVMCNFVYLCQVKREHEQSAFLNRNCNCYLQYRTSTDCVIRVLKHFDLSGRNGITNIFSTH